MRKLVLLLSMLAWTLFVCQGLRAEDEDAAGEQPEAVEAEEKQEPTEGAEQAEKGEAENAR
ncbi:MAG: hypothetical protein ACYTF6_11615 [Planctomycetota bacterium]|jgi:hypothetical protein